MENKSADRFLNVLTTTETYSCKLVLKNRAGIQGNNMM